MDDEHKLRTLEFDLSKKILSAIYESWDDVIPTKDVKEFIRLLKENLEDMKGRSKNEIIDKLAGKQLR